MKKIRYTFTAICFLLCISIGALNAQCILGVGTNTNDATCAGLSDGSVQIEAINAQLPVSYGIAGPISLNGASDTAIFFINNLEAGTYTIDMWDNQNCTVSANFTINEPSAITLTANIQTVSCNGGNDGAAEVVAAGGTPPYTYQWNDPANQLTSVVTNLSAGTYTVTVTDNNGCTETISVAIDEPSAMIATTNATNVSCNGNTDGSVVATVFGGTAPYTYDWNNGVTGPFNTGLPAGVYEVTITDANGCIAVQTFVITEPSELEIDQVAILPACDGQCNGRIDVVATGGVGGYSYIWSDGQNAAIAVSLCAGDYTLTVTDANGCSLTATYTVAGAPLGSLVLELDQTDVSCFDNCDGSVNVTVRCGTSPYTYDWSDDSLDAMDPNFSLPFDGLCPGTYALIVTDGGGNTAEATVLINEPSELVINLISITDSGCAGQNDGSIDIAVSGGTPPYSYLWSNIFTTEDLTGLSPGTYDVTVTDANDCSATISASVSSPNDIVITATVTPISCQGDGAVDITVTGGFPPYTYDWGDIPGTNNLDDRFNLEEGTYPLVVTDTFGCTQSIEFTIAPPFFFDVDVTPTACDSTGGTATVMLGGGITNATYAWSNNGAGPSQSNLSPGGYSVTVTDTDTDCRTHQNFEITVDSACLVYISGHVLVDNDVPDCVQDAGTDGLANILVTLSNGMQTFTNADGFYLFETVPDMYSISIDYDPAVYTDLCVGPIQVDANTGGETYSGNDFYLDFKSVHDLGLKVSKLNPRPGFTRSVRICVMNYGATPMDGTLTFIHDPLQTFSSATIQPTSYDPNTQTFTWDFTNHEPGRIIVYTVYMTTPVNVPPGTLLDYHFVVNPIAGDINPIDNEITRQCMVTNSFDPNDKQVTPVGEGPLGGIQPMRGDSLLSYQIRFQNTGTDTAFTVVIRDTLDSDLKVRDIEPGPSSHPYELTIASGNVLEFTFNNIYLPDSNVNEPLSHGFVFYDVLVDENLPVGTEIHNTAGIYFDFNAPVITNTVLNTIFGENDTTYLLVEACGKIVYNGNFYSVSTEVTDTFDMIYYDSIVITDIQIQQPDDDHFTEVYCAGDNPVDAGTYTTTYTNTFGCDSTVHIEVIVHDTFEIVENVVLLPGEIYNGVGYFNDTTLVKDLTTIHGCDSSHITHITIDRNVYTYLEIIACDEINLNGQIFTESTTLMDTIMLAQYDSIVVTEIMINESDEIFLSEEYCDGENPVDGGTYTTIFQNQVGCDSIVVLEVIVHDTFIVNSNVILEPGEEYQGTPYFNDTTFVQSLMTTQGCDSIVTVHIDVMTTSLTVIDDSGLSIGISPNPSTGFYYIDLQTKQPQPLIWRVYNTIGKELRSGLWMVASEDRKWLDLSSVSPGVYLLQLEFEGQLHTQKLIKIGH